MDTVYIVFSILGTALLVGLCAGINFIFGWNIPIWAALAGCLAYDGIGLYRWILHRPNRHAT